MVLRCFFPNTDLRANSGKGVTRADLVMQFNMLKVLDDFFLSFLFFFFWVSFSAEKIKIFHGSSADGMGWDNWHYLVGLHFSQ